MGRVRPCAEWRRWMYALSLWCRTRKKEREEQRTECGHAWQLQLGNNTSGRRRRRRRAAGTEQQHWQYITRADLDPHATLCLADLRSFFHGERASIDKTACFSFLQISASCPALLPGVPCAREHVYYFHLPPRNPPFHMRDLPQNGIYPGLTLLLPRPLAPCHPFVSFDTLP